MGCCASKPEVAPPHPPAPAPAQGIEEQLRAEIDQHIAANRSEEAEKALRQLIRGKWAAGAFHQIPKLMGELADVVERLGRDAEATTIRQDMLIMRRQTHQ